MNKEEIADELAIYAEYLELDGQTGRAHAYKKAEQAIRTSRYIPPNPARLNGIGPSTREAVIELDRTGELSALEELREKYPWFDTFRQVKHIGTARAEQLHDRLRIDNIDDLILAGRAGDLTLLDGVGAKTAEKILESAREVRDK